MYAIIEVGGKQYKVEKDDIIDVERQEKREHSSLSLNKALLIADKENITVGQPYIKGVKITAEIIKNLKARKVTSYKYRRRKDSHWKKGHRQLISRIRIKEITLPV